MDKNQVPFQYLLFIFGDFKGKDKIIELIATQLSAFTDKDTYVKYNYGDYGVVMNLQSHFSFLNLRDHVHIIMEKVVPQYFLIETPKNFYAFMPPELKLNLFDLTEENQKMEEKEENFKDFTNIIDNFFFNIPPSLSEDIFSEDITSDIFNKIMFKVDENKKLPTIDELLEKIKEKGLNSLTETEKQLLDEYSKS